MPVRLSQNTRAGLKLFYEMTMQETLPAVHMRLLLKRHRKPLGEMLRRQRQQNHQEVPEIGGKE